MTSLYEHISNLAKTGPQSPALVECDKEGAVVREISYGELLEHITGAAAGLAATGVRKGERIALVFDNPVDQLIATWAAWASGVSVVPFDTKRDTKELEEFKLKTSKAKKVLRAVPEGEGEAEWMPDTAHEALVLFTSGTTAHPKGAKLSLKNLVVNAEGIVEWLQITQQDRFLTLLPLHHINSTTFCLSVLLAGGTILVPPAYSASHFWRVCARTGATLTSIVQSVLFDQLSREAEFLAARDALKLSRIQIGSAPVVAHAVAEFMEKFGIPVYQGYGQTETALRVTGVPMDLPPAAYRKAVEENSIGTPMPWAEVEVMGERGNILGEGGEGELAVRGPAVMSGYIGGEDAFRNGYFLTGDIGLWRTTEGKRFFYLKGRKKEIIIKGGVNISPIAVENALKKVSPDIEQAYVVGVPDERYGEEVGAVICWRGGVDSDEAMRSLKLRLLLGSEHVSAYETPTRLAGMESARLPTTSTGKVQRVLLKERVKTWESTGDLLRTAAHRFVVIGPHSPLFEKSLALYNHCWRPLEKSEAEYRKFLSDYHTLAAVEEGGRIACQIAFDKNLTCVSICSAAYKQKPIPEVSKVPDEAEVRSYIPHDPVIKFHLALGARVAEVLPDARPEDKSALGYMVRMRYDVPKNPAVDESAPVSHQLIQIVLLLARDLNLPHIDALSRPGGLAAFLAAQR